MQANSKTFRLFISSTFSDFQNERELLQTKVFPKIKEYCSNNGYTFQPIDLRWGVSNEAQLDQKGLDMCLEEVQSCKTHDYPNFLIMLGDRYGWIPIPNIIVKNEFKLLVQNLNIKDKKLLDDWYFKDENQLPISYVLRKREDQYINYDVWIEVENELRDILQSAVSDLNLNENAINKYFTSATESEAIEGIISYFHTTNSQKKLLKYILDLEHIDAKHIFGFFRNISTASAVDDKYISKDYGKAQEFKQKVRDVLPKHNILDVTTAQVDQNNLDNIYLQKFVSSVTLFLKKQVDEQISKDNQLNYSDLEIEKSQQRHYLNQKVENFLGQDKILNDIKNYISNENDKPLIICGKSGIGKSAVIAKAIEDTSNHFSKKIIYRFVGATPNSTTTKDILTSILEELNISIKDEEQGAEAQNQFISDIDKEENSFIKFSDKVYKKIMGLSDDLVIFIDAVDQLTNDDQFLWLPDQLPSNIKVIISALKDVNYEDSKYFDILSNKSLNTAQVKSFDKPIKLLKSLLSKENRTLQDAQQEYFLKQFDNVKTPLYISIAATQIKYWTSSNNQILTLASTQQEIVKEYIENLTLLHHHNKLLVQKILGYIYSSKDGLSEYEILGLLNTDKEFIELIAPDTWHANATQELPLVQWTRLYAQLKPFLSKKNQDRQELLYFYHREFIDIVKNQSNQKIEHENIILATQKLILDNQDKEFSNNRWGNLYISLLGQYYLEYDDENKIKKYSQYIGSIINENWLVRYIDNIQKVGKNYYVNNKFTKALLYRKIVYFTVKILNQKSDNWSIPYIQSSHNIASIYCQLDRIKEAIEIEKENLIFIDSISDNQRLHSIEYSKKLNSEIKESSINDINDLTTSIWSSQYLGIMSVLSSCYSKNNEIDKAIELDKKSLYISEALYQKETFWIKHFLMALGNLAESLSRNDKINEAIALQEKALFIIKKSYDKNTNYLVEDYGRVLNSLSVLLVESAPVRSKELQGKSKKIFSTLYSRNPDRYSDQLHTVNINKISIGINSGDIDDLEEYYYDSIKALNHMENIDKKEWVEDSSNELFVKSYELFQEGKLEQSIKCLELTKKIIEYIYEQDQDYWAVFYIQKLLALAKVLNDNNQNEDAKSFQEEAVDICENYFNDNKTDWGDLYTKALNNLSTTYKALKSYNEALDLDKLNMDISYQFYEEDPIKWYRAYYHALTNISDTYDNLKNINESDKFLKLSYGVKVDKLISSPEQFKDEAMRLLNDYDEAHKAEETKELLKSLIYLEEFLKVCKAMYEKDVKWTAPYVEMLNKVAHGYTTCPTPQSGKKIRQYTNESLKIIKPLARQYPQEWGPVYKNIIKNKRNFQKILYGTYIFGSAPIIIVIATIYFIFK